MSDELNLTAYCGLFCADCIRFKSKAADLARRLMQELDSTEFAEYAARKSGSSRQLDAVKAFSHFHDCTEFLKALVDQQCSTSCREGGGCSAFSCGILACCQDKGYIGCWECDSFETCEKLDGLNSISGTAHRDNLKAVNTYGFPEWTKHRSQPYIWQQK